MDKSIDAFSMTMKTYAFEDTLVWTGYRNKGYCESVQSSKAFEVLYQKVHEIIVGSLSNSVFEQRTSTGSGLFASLGSGLVETLG